KAVAKKDPDALLAGSLYQQYIYPPQQGSMSLPDNFVPKIAPSFDYGYGLYRPETRKKFKYVFKSWAKVAPPIWFYIDWANVLKAYENIGLVAPPATSMLNFIFHH